MSYTCTFIQKNGPFQHENFISTLTLTGTDAASQRFPDPVVIQLPTDASDFTGAFLHVDSGVDGKLAMTTGLSSLRADSLHILKAKPGTQLIVLDLPEGVPTTGDFQFRFNFKLPAGASSLEFKPMFTGRVKVNGETFYPPLLPCVMDFASVPAVTVEASLQDGTVLPEGETVTIVLPLEEVLGRGCANMIYEFPTSAAVDMRPGSGSNGFNSNGYGNLAVVRPYEGILMRFNAPPVSVY
jgi:hypothetical protein